MDRPAMNLLRFGPTSEDFLTFELITAFAFVFDFVFVAFVAAVAAAIADFVRD